MLTSLISRLFTKHKSSPYVIYWFEGTAIATSRNMQNYTAGEKHAIMLFLRQEPNTKPDYIAAEKEIRAIGWENIEIKLSYLVDSANKLHNSTALATFRDAMEHGFAAIISSEPEK